MNKKEFLELLQQALYGLPVSEIRKHMEFYSEMIDDRIEDGLTEAEAVAAVGDPRQIARQLTDEAVIPQRTTPRRSPWMIVLLVLGSPVWLSLLAAAFAVVLSLYAVLWSVLISLYAVPVSLAAVAVSGLVLGVILPFTGKTPLAISLLGAALICAGLCIFFFYLCHWAAKGTLRLTVRSFTAICSLFRKEKTT